MLMQILQDFFHVYLRGFQEKLKHFTQRSLPSVDLLCGCDFYHPDFLCVLNHECHFLQKSLKMNAENLQFCQGFQSENVLLNASSHCKTADKASIG